MSASPSAPTSSAASPPSATTWSAGFSEPAARRLRALLAAAGPWSGHVGLTSLRLEAPLDATTLPHATLPGHGPWRLLLRRSGPLPTTLSLQGSGPAGWRLPVVLGDLDLPAPHAPEEAGDLLARTLEAALCPLLARRADLALLLVRQRLAQTGARRALLRRHRSDWILTWSGRRCVALPPRHRWRTLLGHWLLQARRPAFSEAHALPRLEGFHLLALHTAPSSAHERLLLQAEIDRLSTLLFLDDLA